MRRGSIVAVDKDLELVMDVTSSWRVAASLVAKEHHHSYTEESVAIVAAACMQC